MTTCPIIYSQTTYVVIHSLKNLFVTTYITALYNPRKFMTTFMTALYIFFVLNPRRDKFPSDGTLSYIHIYSTLPKYLTGQKCNPGEYKFLYTGSFTQLHTNDITPKTLIRGQGQGLGSLLGCAVGETEPFFSLLLLYTNQRS